MNFTKTNVRRNRQDKG